jgi:hypothetical protein
MPTFMVFGAAIGISWFGGQNQFEEFHHGMVDEKAMAALIDEDLV